MVGLISTSASANTPNAAPTGPITMGSTAVLTNISIQPPAGAFCAADSATGGYRWDTFLTNADPNVLTFGAAGPVGPAGKVVFPLFSTAGTAVITQATAVGSPALLTGIPAGFSFGVAALSTLPSGVYQVGFACDNAAIVGATAGRGSDKLWFSPVTITSTGAAITAVSFGAAPSAPVLSVTSFNATSVTIGINAPVATPAATAINVTYTPVAPLLAGAVTVTSTLPGTATSDTKTLVSGQLYNVTATQTNTIGASPVSNTVSVTPSQPATYTASATPAPLQVTVSVTAPSVGTVTSYVVSAGLCPVGTTPTTCTLAGSTAITGSPATITPPATSTVFTGLAAGSLYVFSVHANFAPGTSAPDVVNFAAPFANTLIIQDLFVNRPAGALVLTQRCGVHAGMPQEIQTGFGTIPADTDTPGLDPVTHVPAVNNATTPASQTGVGTAPTGSATTNSNVSGAGDPVLVAGSPLDPVFGQYPYPVDANGVPAATYPTHCGVNLGTGKLITGDGLAGEYFAATGRLNQVTVVDTRDANTSWNLTGSASAFTSASDSFSADYLGWTTQVTNTSGATLAGYKQVVTAGPTVNPGATATAAGINNLAGVGLGTSRTAASAAAGAGLGIATIDGRLKLLIPLTAKNGIYTSTLTFNVI
jgi:hypothetical protein